MSNLSAFWNLWQKADPPYSPNTIWGNFQLLRHHEKTPTNKFKSTHWEVGPSIRKKPHYQGSFSIKTAKNQLLSQPRVKSSPRTAQSARKPSLIQIKKGNLVFPLFFPNFFDQLRKLSLIKMSPIFKHSQLRTSNLRLNTHTMLIRHGWIILWAPNHNFLCFSWDIFHCRKIIGKIS